MQDSMYSALFGALTQEHRMDIIANNLANVNTTGFKQDRVAFKDVFVRFAHDRVREPIMNLRDKALFPEATYLSKVRIAESQIDFSQGSLKRSDNPLDLAISGEGFFKVQDENGTSFYTRNGHFGLNAEGELINGSGLRVMADGGPVEIPENARVEVTPDGRILANNAEVGTLDIVTVSDHNALRKIGSNLFEIHPEKNAEEMQAAEATVQQGFLEAPNVEIVTEMVNMIETQRSFEAYQKTMTTAKETDSKAINSVGKV
ncbi:flagellar basal-body rod protein FlgF [Desulfobaculum bizertense]|uniref:flagellar basal-body rod protein FlgF n=1 Tax=Desulfobaculum bizertense TaxID=376490 RepID=UPI001F421483|nr:flagellar basal-body rod protein FlgF [Desulfobaculum bizertense]UIJ39052.1 flagellar basal-body rod protein FlgF [Desulfobaculum bizertense]